MSIEKLRLSRLESLYDTDPTPDDGSPFETICRKTLRYEGDTVRTPYP